MTFLAFCLAATLSGTPEVPRTPIDSVYTVVQQAATFPGGTLALKDYLEANTKRPVPARRAHVHGNVYVKMVIEKDGSVSTVSVVKGIGFGCDEEALRVIREMPAWKPARNKGNEVASLFNLIVRF